VPPPRPDRPGDPELAAALGREHHEDQEDQQEPGEDREAPERREQRHESVALLVRRFQGVALDGIDLEAEPLQGRLQQRRDLVRVANTGRRAADVRDHHVFDLARVVEESLGGGKADQERPAVRARAVVLDDGPHARERRAAAGEHTDPVARLRAEVVGRIRVQVDLAGPKVVERHDAALRGADAPERLEVRARAGEEIHARLVLPRSEVLHRDRLDDRRRDAVEVLRPEQLVRDQRDYVLAEVLDAGRLAGRDLRVDVRSADRDQLVRGAERLDRRHPDRVAHRVAGRQRGRDDGRPEHQPGDDERGAAPSACDVAHAELEEDPVAKRERRHQRDDDRE
jgi:hypothetical protein